MCNSFIKRLHNKEKYNGSGIGLATCKKILDRLGSKIEVASTLDEGSEFSFELPLA